MLEAVTAYNSERLINAVFIIHVYFNNLRSKAEQWTPNDRVAVGGFRGLLAVRVTPNAW